MKHNIFVYSKGGVWTIFRHEFGTLEQRQLGSSSIQYTCRIAGLMVLCVCAIDIRWCLPWIPKTSKFFCS